MLKYSGWREPIENPEPIRILPNGDVFVQAVDCWLRCDFCFHGIRKRRPAPLGIRRLAAGMVGLARSLRSPPGSLVAEFERKIEHIPPRLGDRVRLSGWDVLECPEILELLRICRERGKRIEIISPCLRLADPVLAGRVAAFEPIITTTYLTTDPSRYAAMTGHPLAKPLVDRALANLIELGVTLSASCVVTRTNVEDVPAVADRLLGSLGLPRMGVAFFSPDRCYEELEPPPWHLFPSFEQLDAALREALRRVAGSGRRLELWRVPPCQLGEDLLRAPEIAFLPEEGYDPEVRPVRDPACERCAWSPRCCFLSPYYLKQIGKIDFDPHRVNRWADRLAP